jgi:hypothetical protein
MATVSRPQPLAARVADGSSVTIVRAADAGRRTPGADAVGATAWNAGAWEDAHAAAEDGADEAHHLHRTRPASLTFLDAHHHAADLRDGRRRHRRPERGYETKVFCEHIAPVDMEWVAGSDWSASPGLTGSNKTFALADFIRPTGIDGVNGTFASYFANLCLEASISSSATRATRRSSI